MNNETLDHGTIAENIIDNLCQVKFFKDFVARSPKYNKSNGNKEISDVLVVFNDVILNFQVKSKLENKNFYQKEKKDIERIESKITKAVEQLKELTSVLRNKIVCDIKNSRGIKIPLPDGAKKIGIICLNLAGEEKFPTSEQTGLRMLFDEKYDHEIHFFKIEVLNLILSELTTLPDFLHYLEFRRQYIANGLLTPTIPEYDFLAFYKTQYATALKFLDDKKAGKNVMVYLEPGLWENYLQNEDVIVQRNMANEISGWYDDIIDTKSIFQSIILFQLQMRMTIGKQYLVWHV